jgi:hypothetical protein
MAAVAPALNADQLFERERLRWMSAIQKEDQRLWDATDMMRKAQNVTYGIKPEKNGRFDISPHIIASAHISTAMQGSIFPGVPDPSIRGGKVVLASGNTIKKAPFNSFGSQPAAGVGDRNTDDMLQQALRQYLSKGDLELRNALTFNDRPGRGV